MLGVATLALGGLAVSHAGPGVTAIGPLRQRFFPRLAGQGRACARQHPHEQHSLHDQHRGQTEHEADRNPPVEAPVSMGRHRRKET